MLAHACTQDEGAIDALRSHRKRSDVKDSIAWITGSFETPTSAAARRVGQHFADEAGIDNAAEWAVSVARRFTTLLG